MEVRGSASVRDLVLAPRTYVVLQLSLAPLWTAVIISVIRVEQTGNVVAQIMVHVLGVLVIMMRVGGVLISRLRSLTGCTGCLTLLEILEIYWNYFFSWKSTGNSQSFLEIFWFSLRVCTFVR